MEDYKLPEKTQPLRVLAKASSAVGLYFICPVCQFNMLEPDMRLATGRRNCPNCHTDLIFPQGPELDLVIKKSMEAFIP
jgi:hypothetical protein